MVNVLIVCHGNVNRSALGAAVLRKEMPDATIVSVGLKVTARRAAKKCRDWALLNGYDLTAHTPQPIELGHVLAADQVILMDNGNRRRFQDKFGAYTDKVVQFNIKDPGFLAKDDPLLPVIYNQVVSACKEFANDHKHKRDQRVG